MAAETSEVQRAQEQFRDELLRAGVLVDGGSPGLYLRSGTFERIVAGIDRLVSEAGRSHRAPVLHFPAVMTRRDFEATGYVGSFPDLLGSIHTFGGGDREHRRMLAEVEEGGSWTEHLQPSDLMMCSAACHPLYPTRRGKLARGGEVYEVFGQVFRHEPSVDPARMQTFRQHEFVRLGDDTSAVAHRDAWVERAVDIHRSLGLDVSTEVANDPFFGRAGRIMADSQRDEALKIEIVATVSSEDRPTAITSANCHQDHFGQSFGIETAEGRVAHTSCVGFGVERITLALYRRHGLDVEAWPAQVRSLLAV